MTVFRFTTIFRVVAFAQCATSFNIAHADASGPDFFKVRSVPYGATVPLRDRPVASTIIATIPADATCIRNEGCQGGLMEGMSLSESEQAKQLVANPRWCKVEYRGLKGWVEGKLLAEGSCVSSSTRDLAPGSKPVTVRGTINGTESTDYRIKALAGQTLTVLLKARHPQTYFNLIQSGGQEAMFIGSIAGNKAEVIIPTDGDYTLQVYSMRTAARGGSSSNFTISARLHGQSLLAISGNKDALVQDTPFHATAVIKCPPLFHAGFICDAGVIRRGLDGTGTVQIRWPQGKRHILFIGGKARASDTAYPMTSSRKKGISIVTIGKDEIFEIPDALLKGG